MMVVQLSFNMPRRGETHLWTNNKSVPLGLSVLIPAVGLVIHLYIWVLPVIAVSQPQLPTRRKVGVIDLHERFAVWGVKAFTIQMHLVTIRRACLYLLLSMYYRYILTRTNDTTWILMPGNTVT